MKGKSLFLIIYFLLPLSCFANKQNEVFLEIAIPTDSIYHNLRCDSIYYQSFMDYNRSDTTINGIKYVLVLPISDKHSLAFRVESEKYKSLQYINLLVDGVPVQLYEHQDSDEENLYYGDFLPSPSKKYIYISVYYSTLSMKSFSEGIEEEIIRFGSGHIIDLEQAKVVDYLLGMDVAGDWNYCDQWIVDGKVLFDPENVEL